MGFIYLVFGGGGGGGGMPETMVLKGAGDTGAG